MVISRTARASSYFLSILEIIIIPRKKVASPEINDIHTLHWYYLELTNGKTFSKDVQIYVFTGYVSFKCVEDTKISKTQVCSTHSKLSNKERSKKNIYLI